MKAIIFSYNREAMLRDVIAQMYHNAIDYHVIDDGSDSFDPGAFVPGDRLTRFKHGGKKSFWVKFMLAFNICKESEHDEFMFIPDDFERIDFPEIRTIQQGWKDSEYCVNLANDGRTECWGHYRMGLKPISTSTTRLIEVGFCDCGFITNRKSIQLIDIDAVPATWFNRADKSSGVGEQLTTKFRLIGVPMLTPEKSFCFHGNHESKMHGDHRKEVKLITK